MAGLTDGIAPNVGQLCRARQIRPEELADLAGVDVATVREWERGTEPIPDILILPLAELFGVSVGNLMGWNRAPRSAIPERWRTHLAQDAREGADRRIPQACELLVELVERRLGVDRDLDDAESAIVPRLQALRAAVLAFLAEPVDETA
jgi:transcriptional regulator with XRE-family HTH domain